MPDPFAGERRDLTLDLCGCAPAGGPTAVEAALLHCRGVEAVHVDTYLTWALITFTPTATTPDAIVEHLAAAGLDVRVTRLFDPVRAAPATAVPAPDSPTRRPPDQETP